LINETHRANQALENILQTISQVPASIFSGPAAGVLRQDLLLARLARLFQIDRTKIRERLIELRSRKAPSRSHDRDQANAERTKIDFSRLDSKERELIQFLILLSASAEEAGRELLERAIENISPNQFGLGPLRDLYELICEGYHLRHDVNIDWLMLKLEQPLHKNLLVYLYDQALAMRQNTAEGIESGITASRQLNCLINAFGECVAESGNQNAILQLQRPNLAEDEELKTLEELLIRTKQRQGIPAPTDGWRP
jgi:DNA primase